MPSYCLAPGHLKQLRCNKHCFTAPHNTLSISTFTNRLRSVNRIVNQIITRSPGYLADSLLDFPNTRGIAFIVKCGCRVCIKRFPVYSSALVHATRTCVQLTCHLGRTFVPPPLRRGVKLSWRAYCGFLSVPACYLFSKIPTGSLPLLTVQRVCSNASLYVPLRGPLARAHAHRSAVMWDAPSPRPPLRRGVKLGLLRVGVKAWNRSRRT